MHISIPPWILPDVCQRPPFNLLSCRDHCVAWLPVVIGVVVVRIQIWQPARPLGRLFRLLLLPAGLSAAFTTTTFRDYSGGYPWMNHHNYGVGIACFAASLKMVESAFSTRKPTKLVRNPQSLKDTHNGAAQPKSNGVGHASSMPREVDADNTWTDAFGIIGDPRCVVYNPDPKAFRPPENRDVTNRASFCRSTAWSAAAHVLSFDVCQTIIQSVPGTTAGTPYGGSIYVDDTPWRYAYSTVLVLAQGCGTYCGFQAGHDLLVLNNVLLLGLEPEDHPPMFWEPWKSTSLRELWSKRWHAVFRGYFQAIGWIPGSFILGNMGGVLAVFTVSGLLHAPTVWGMGHGVDYWRILGFFYLQGVGIVLEDLWRRATGMKVRGPWGRIWTITFVLVTAHLVVEAWLQTGLSGCQWFLPDDWRPLLLLRNYLTTRFRL